MDDKASLEKIIEGLKKDIELNPYDYMVYFDIGVAYYKLKEYDKALEAYQKAIEINPQYNKAYHNIGIIHRELKEYDKAVLAYQKAIELNPKEDATYNNIGVVYGHLNEHEKAIEYFQKAIEINTKNVEAYSNIGFAYRKLKKYDKAQEYFEKEETIEKQNEYRIKVLDDTKRLKEVSIADYHMFKDFEIDFTNKENNPLDIIVIAGENGTGKTTLFELIKEYSLVPDDVVYLPAYRENIEDLKATMLQKYIDIAYELNDFKKALKEVNEFISDIFEGLKFNFTISKIDYNQKSVRFTNSANDEFEIESLSTGEKTLLSKVLFLYFKDYKEKIILIDEPEISLHPSWQNHILKIYENFAKKYDSQVIIATHSPQIIGSAKPQSLRILNKREDGKIEVVDNYSQSYGLEVNKILLDIMGMSETRTPAVDK